MPNRLRTLWLAWTAIILAALLALLGGAGLLAMQTAQQLAAPELRQTTQVVGRALATDIERALRQQIPIDALVGIEPWFADVVDANPVLAMLALTDRSGRLLDGHAVPAELRAVLPGRRAAASDQIGALQLTTLPLHDAGGTVAGWLHVGGVAPAIGGAPWLWTLAAAALLTLLAARGLWLLLRQRVAAPLAACRAVGSAVADGHLPTLAPPPVQAPASLLLAALAGRIHAVHRQHENLLLKIGEVRAAHFDPAILVQVDQLAASLDWRQAQQPAAAGAAAARRPAPSLSRRALLASALALLLVAASLFALQRLSRAADGRQLVASAEHTLQQAWQATLDQDRARLDAILGQLLAGPGFRALLAGSDDRALDLALTQAATPPLALTVLRLDGTMRAASAEHNEEAALGNLVLGPLRQGQELAHGVWQDAVRSYQSGVARRVALPGAASAVVVAARPLEASVADLARRLAAPAAAADLRGQPLTAGSAELVADWRAHGRQGYLHQAGAASAALAAATLSAPSGHALGTLLARLPTESRMTAAETSLALLAAASALATALLLLAFLAGLFAPLARATEQLEALADGAYEPLAMPRAPGHETARLYQVRSLLGEKIDMLQTLRRSRERQGRRQARFIRHQMHQLASRLDENARRGILEDLERIEYAGRPSEARPPGDERLDRIVDEFGILALGFQNLVSRVGAQYQELDRLVQELREALRAKTQFIALQQELEIARKMQLSILPREFQPRDGLELHATMLPAKEIGGDFYDFFALDQHRVALVVADVSGKGVPAAFFMAVSRTLLRAIAQFSDRPGHCLQQLNDLLAADNEEMMFVTLFYAIFDTRDGRCSYANAGHNPPYLLRADGRVEMVPSTGGMALAVMDGLEFKEGSLTLAPGDGLFLYTDGITEACAPSEVLYGDARLITALQEIGTLPVREIPARMVALIKEFEAGGAQADDITCLMARYRGRP